MCDSNSSVTSSSSPWSSPRPVDVYWWQHLLMLMFSQADRNPLSYSELCYVHRALNYNATYTEDSAAMIHTWNTMLKCYINGTFCYNATYMVHFATMLHKRNTLLQCYIHGALALFFIIGSVCLLNRSTLLFRVNIDHTGWFFNWPPLKS